MTRQQGSKRVRRPKTDKNKYEDKQDESEDDDLSDNQVEHPSKKKVRWENTADESAAESPQDPSDSSDVFHKVGFGMIITFLTCCIVPVPVLMPAVIPRSV